MRHFLRLGERTVSLGEALLVGRNTDCDLVLDVPGVSGRHARFARVGDAYEVSDCGSTNGTKVGGVRLRAGVSRTLTHGDLVLFGTVTATYHAVLEVSQAPGASTAKVAFAMVQAMLESQDRGPIVRVVEGAEVGQQLPLPMGASRIVGRLADVDLRLGGDGVSGRHLEIRRSPLGVLVRDLGSRFGSHLGPMRLAEGQWQAWEPGRSLRLSKTVVLGLDAPRTAEDFAPVSVVGVAPAAVAPVSVTKAPISDAPPNSSVRETGPQSAAAVVALPVAAPAAPLPVTRRALPSWAPYALGAAVLVLTVAALVWLLRS